MSRPHLTEHGEIDLKSVESLSRDDLASWVRKRLHRVDWNIPGGAQGSEMPHYLFALLYPKFGRVTREEFQNIIIEYLEDLAGNPSSEWLDDSGHELIMLVDPVLVQSPRREEAIDLLLSIVASDYLKSDPWPNLHLRALQGLIALRHRVSIDFWREQSVSQDTRYAPTILEGLALIDVAAPFSWLKDIAWDDAVEDAVVGLLPGLLETYGTAKVVKSLENVLPSVSQRAASCLLTFCEQEGITISGFSQSYKQPQTNYFPLSFAQQRFWFLDQLQGGSPFYNLQTALRINGPLDVAILEGSLREIVRRHETLRTTFQLIEGIPMQVISPDISLPFLYFDLGDLPHTEHERALNEFSQEDAQRPFDLATGPLLRLALLRFAETEHVLLITMHHIISDEWSIGIFIREMGTLYQAFEEGEPSPLPELSMQYADFCIWQREWLIGENLERQLTYWRHQLKNATSVLRLPTDKPRPHVQTFHGSEHRFMLSEELVSQLRDLGGCEGVTLFMTLLAAYQILLYRYTDQEDIIVGVPVGNRDQPELKQLIGCFVNTLALRMDMSHDPTIPQLLSRIRKVCLGAYEHKDLPFEKIVEELLVERDLSRTPLCQVMFVFENVPSLTSELPGLSIAPMLIARGSAQFDLTLIVTEVEHGVRCVFEYNTDLFSESTVIRIANNFEHLLSAIVGQPHSRLSALALLNAAEQHQLIVQWNNNRMSVPPYTSIAEWFAEQAERSPNALALIDEDQQLSYKELNQRANQLAQRLVRIGVQPEMLVGICLERSIDQIVAVLGVLKAGAAYVPLAPHYPQARLDYILYDTRATVALTTSHLLETFSNCDAQIVCLDSEWPPISDESINNPLNDTHVLSEHSAYVIYTSGTTGMPKGVVVTHRNLIHSTAARIHYYQEPVTSFLLLSPLEFDSSVAGIFWTLCSGGALILAPKDYRERPQLIAEQILRHNVSHILTLPSLYRVVLEGAESSQLKSLRTVILAGEACPIEVVNFHYTLLSKTHLFNEYGPTETTVWSTVHSCPKTKSAIGSVSIGRPISNTQIYLLDRDFNLVPIGVPGELHIGGGGLARGYLQRPGITAERFIPNPFSVEPGARLYKTGDLARYLPDGSLEFLGRSDHQVKVRGFRIELGEIEALLTQHELVRDAIVVARNDLPRGLRLVAYVVPIKETIALRISELRSYLAAKLPDYMIPSSFVRLQEVPLTPNGKVDRRALPAPEEVDPWRDRVPVSPRTPLEAVLAYIWGEVLHLNNISVNDNFFELGGDSITAIRLISRIHQMFQVEIRVSMLFEYQTISELATAIAHFTGQTLERGKYLQSPSDQLVLSDDVERT